MELRIGESMVNINYEQETINFNTKSAQCIQNFRACGADCIIELVYKRAYNHLQGMLLLIDTVSSTHDPNQVDLTPEMSKTHAKSQKFSRLRRGKTKQVLKRR